MTGNHSADVLFTLDKISVSLAGAPVLRDVSLSVKKGEAVAITGASGSGKTVLAHMLSGRHFYRGGYRVKDGTVEDFQAGVQVIEQQHRFRNRNQTADQYYQQRYNAVDSNETVTVSEDLVPYGDGTIAFPKTRLLELFGVGDLLGKPLIQLSNGENKRLQMVKALLMPHGLLIFDQPYTGLDTAGRKALTVVLEELHRAGETVLLITGSRDIPTCFGRQIIMDKGAVLRDGATGNIGKKAESEFGLRPIPDRKYFQYPPFEFAFRLRKVNIRYDAKLILDDVSWSVKRGECWSLSGPNGAGKSTLLSLVTGDNPQAYANDITLFDRQRGTGESIWEIKQRTGFISPELHLFFDPAATVQATLASGLFDTIGLFRTLTADQEMLVKDWADFLGLNKELNGLLNRLPAGKQRIALLGRAMIKLPPLLILDEPCQGLDESDIESVKQLVDGYCKERGATLIYVSHYPDEWPACVNHAANLDNGRITTTY